MKFQIFEPYGGWCKVELPRRKYAKRNAQEKSSPVKEYFNFEIYSKEESKYEDVFLIIKSRKMNSTVSMLKIWINEGSYFKIRSSRIRTWKCKYLRNHTRYEYSEVSVVQEKIGTFFSHKNLGQRLLTKHAQI